METLKIGSAVCRVKRSDRRTVTMRSGKDGVPEILAPNRMSLGELERICAPYEQNLVKMSEKQKEINALREAFVLDYGSSVRVLDKEWVIREGKRGFVGYDEQAFNITPDLNTEEIRRAVVKIYKLFAKNYLSRRTSQIADMMGLEMPTVKINSAESHWASCSKKASLNFSWYTVMARPETVDYIIIHELCHMRHFNHSTDFWAEVEKYSPDYKQHKIYLKGLWQEIVRQRWD